MITVPAMYGSSVSDRGGAEGSAWVARLPRLIDRLCGRWDLTVDGPPAHGYHGLVVPVRRGGGPSTPPAPCALKVSWVDASVEQEIRALELWDGRGMVRLLDAAPELGALLLERLDVSRPLSEEPIESLVPTAGDLIRLLAIHAEGAGPVLPTVADWAGEVGRGLHERWDAAGRPMARRLVDLAAGVCFALPRGTDRRLVNWDLHYENVLAGERMPWIAIDPKAMVGPPEFGVAQLLWRLVDYLDGPADLARWTDVLVDRGGLDPEATRAWNLVRVVDYWLWALGIGLTEDPRRCATLLEWAGY